MEDNVEPRKCQPGLLLIQHAGRYFRVRTKLSRVQSYYKMDRRSPQGPLKSLPVPHLPFEIISTDEMSGFPEVGGKDVIMVIRDRATKYTILIPVSKTLIAENMEDIFFDEVAVRFGLPRQIVSDRGSKYTSDFGRSLPSLWGSDEVSLLRTIRK